MPSVVAVTKVVKERTLEIPLGRGGGLEIECNHMPEIRQSWLGNDASIKTLTLMVG